MQYDAKKETITKNRKGAEPGRDTTENFFEAVAAEKLPQEKSDFCLSVYLLCFVCPLFIT